MAAKNTDGSDISRVYSLLSDIGDNSKNINVMLKDKYNLIGEIKSALSVKARAGVCLTEAQISRYREFEGIYEKNNSLINSGLSKLEAEIMVSAGREILKKQANRDSFANKLRRVTDGQMKIILSLAELIDAAAITLSVL
jgi:hypothetical protein